MVCETKIECIREIDYTYLVTFDNIGYDISTYKYLNAALRYSITHMSRKYDCKVTAITDLYNTDGILVISNASLGTSSLEYIPIVIAPTLEYVTTTKTDKYQEQFNLMLAEGLENVFSLFTFDFTLPISTNLAIINGAIKKTIEFYGCIHSPPEYR